MERHIYTVEELIDLADFRDWALGRTPGNKFWTDIRNEQVENKKNIDEAVRIVRLLSWDEANLPFLEYKSSLERLQQKMKTKRSSLRMLVFSSGWSKVAAVLVPMFLAIAAYYLIEQRTDQKLGNFVFSTPAGQNSLIVLPDGSELTMKSSTRIEIAEGFGKRNRELTIDGEAFFSVQHNEKLPFLVNARSFQVRVLGTRFNLKAYSDDSHIYTTLVQGKIEVKEEQSKHYSILNPGEQLVFGKESLVAEKRNVDTQLFDRWHGQGMIYEKVPVTEILKDIERIYNVDVNYDGEFKSGNVLTCVFEPGESLEKVLEVVGRTASFTYKLEKKNVILKIK